MLENERELLFNWTSARNCLVSRKIIYENMKVGFCYREEPENEYDSGWRFMVGDEDDDYLNKPENMEILDLNTLCNYDESVLDILNYSYEIALEKKEDGKYHIID